MTKLCNFLHILAWDEAGQDMVEYALLAGFVATAAAGLLPEVTEGVLVIFSQVGSVLIEAE